MSNTITPTVFYRTLNDRRYNKSNHKFALCL